MTIPFKSYKEINPLDSRNVINKYKGLSNEEIKANVKNNSLPFAVLMFNLVQDFNFGSVIRSANALGAREIFYFGEKRFDRRGATGTYKYIDVHYLSSYGEFLNLKNEYSFVALEQNEKSIMLHKFDWKTSKKPLILIGEENCGLSSDIIEICDHIVEIPQRGSVRSINAAVAASICMFDFASKYE